MDNNRFDLFAKTLAGRLSRRAALRGLGGGTVAALGAARLRTAAAQDASPAADGDEVSLLFVQVAESGTFAPKAGEADAYTLTLTGAPTQTVYFSDRPERIAGTIPTERLLDTLGFTPDNPPNAAVVAQTDQGEDVLVVELLNPAYDAATGTLSYDAQLLADYQGEWLEAHEARRDDQELPPQFSPASLFIDSGTAQLLGSCPNIKIKCSANDVEQGSFSTGSCWQELKKGYCDPCDSQDSLNAQCNAEFSSCGGNCTADWSSCFLGAC